MANNQTNKYLIKPYLLSFAAQPIFYIAQKYPQYFYETFLEILIERLFHFFFLELSAEMIDIDMELEKQIKHEISDKILQFFNFNCNFMGKYSLFASKVLHFSVQYLLKFNEYCNNLMNNNESLENKKLSFDMRNIYAQMNYNMHNTQMIEIEDKLIEKRNRTTTALEIEVIEMELQLLNKRKNETKEILNKSKIENEYQKSQLDCLESDFMDILFSNLECIKCTLVSLLDIPIFNLNVKQHPMRDFSLLFDALSNISLSLITESLAVKIYSVIEKFVIAFMYYPSVVKYVQSMDDCYTDDKSLMIQNINTSIISIFNKHLSHEIIFKSNTLQMFITAITEVMFACVK